MINTIKEREVNNNKNELIKENLIPVSKWNNHYSYPTVNAIRQLIFYNTDNFNDVVIRIIGNRQYINVSDFFNWVEKINHK